MIRASFVALGILLPAVAAFAPGEGDDVEIDAVIIGTPMQFHAPQAIQALERGIGVLCEVTAGVSIDECRQLVASCKKSKAAYMMAENYAYIKNNVLVRELVRQGLFGTVYYAEGEYLHELKGLNEITTWRRKWRTGIEGCTYGTHSLGPILQWMSGDRVVRVCCEGSGHHHKDPRGADYAQDTAVMLCKTARGALVKIRVDMLSDRPHAMANYQLQGTDGCYASGRDGPVDRAKIWLRTLSEKVVWHDVQSLIDTDELSARFLPESWRNPPPEALRAGHGGGDSFEVGDFFRAVRGEAPAPFGIHESMDTTLPGLISQQSILNGGAWLDVPDSRTWKAHGGGRKPGTRNGNGVAGSQYPGTAEETIAQSAHFVTGCRILSSCPYGSPADRLLAEHPPKAYVQFCTDYRQLARPATGY